MTSGQQLYWAVQAVNEDGSTDLELGEFTTEIASGNTPFSAVTVITHGFTLLPSQTGVPDAYYTMADQITQANGAENPGLILRYHKPTGNWIPVDALGRTLTAVTGGLEPEDSGYMQAVANNIKANYRNTPLVLLPEWSSQQESIIPDSGFTEAAAK